MRSPRTRKVLVGVAILLAIYLFMRGISAALWWLISDVMAVKVAPLDPARLPVFIASFTLFFVPLLYSGTSLLAGRRLSVEPSSLLLYMGTTFFCASLAEVVADTAFVALVGRPAWLYHIWPVHHGYTSGAGIVMWPLYGYFACFLHEALRHNPRLHALDNDVGKAILVGVDAMVLEVAANVFTLVGFDSFYFYYLAPDLQHFTTAEIFLPYVMAGFVGMKLLGALEDHRHRAWIGVALQLVATGLVLWVL